MTRLIFCRKYQEQLPGLPVPPLPGAMGQTFLKMYLKGHGKIAEPNDAHQRAPSELMDPDARKFLTQEMLRFFDNKEYAKPEGYVPPGVDTASQFLFNTRPIRLGQIAQLVEQRIENPRVGSRFRLWPPLTYYLILITFFATFLSQ